jgi:SAM-dependent methyltransferase
VLGPLIEGKADVVYGSRFMISGERRVLYFWHSIANQMLTAFCNLVADLNLTDMETCYKAFRTSLVQSIPLRSNRFGIEPELTIKLARREVRIYETPISYHGRTYLGGKKIGLKDAVQAIAVILRYAFTKDIYVNSGPEILEALSDARRFNDWMADTIRPYVGKRVLEIGAGIGNLTRALVPRRQCYVAADIDSEHIARLQTRFQHRPNLRVCYCDLSDPRDFEGFQGQMDSIVCLNVLEHVKDDMQSLRNMHAALVPGGRAIVLVPHGQEIFGTLDEVLGHYRRYSHQELRDKMEQVGFRVERILEFNRISRPGWYVTGRILKKTSLSPLQLKVFDRLVWLWRRIDAHLPWPPTSIIAIAVKQQGASRGSVAAEFVGRIEHRHDVFGRDIGHHVVDLVPDEAASGHEDVHAPANVFADLLGSAGSKHLLRVAASAPEGKVAAELAFQALGLHMPGAGLHRVEDLDAGFDQVGNQLVDAAATVQKNVRVAVFAGVAIDALVARQKQLAIALARKLGTALHAQIVAHHQDLHRAADFGQQPAQIFDVQLGQAVQEDAEFALFPGYVGVQILHAEEKLAPLEEIAADRKGDGVAGGLGEMAGDAGDLFQALVGERLIEGRGGKRRPGDFLHVAGQRLEGVEAIGAGKRPVALVDVQRVARHPADGCTAGIAHHQAALFAIRLEPGRCDCRRAVGQGPGAALARGPEGSAEIDGVHVETVEIPGIGLGKLLDEVVEDGGAVRHAEVVLQTVVGDRHDAGGAHGAVVDGHTIRFFVGDGSQDPFPGGHSAHIVTGLDICFTGCDMLSEQEHSRDETPSCHSIADRDTRSRGLAVGSRAGYACAAARRGDT